MNAGAEATPIVFPCQGDDLVGILHLPANPGPKGVVIVPGAPQYRAGSHRQFLHLARDLAAAGVSVLRFDYRGTGDSDGDFKGFEALDDDIAAAVDALTAQAPGVREVVLWGLCDGASAAAFYGTRDPRIAGLVLVNPWARSEATLAEARVKHYYTQRLFDAEFWRKLIRFEVNPARALGGFLGNWRTARGGGEADETADLPDRVGRALTKFEKPMLVVLSGADLTAQEFDQAVLRSPARGGWAARENVTVQRLEGANHTYSTAVWRSQIHSWIRQWLSGDDAGT